MDKREDTREQEGIQAEIQDGSALLLAIFQEHAVFSHLGFSKKDPGLEPPDYAHVVLRIPVAKWDALKAALPALRPEGPGEPCEPEHSSPSTPHPQREG